MHSLDALCIKNINAVSIEAIVFECSLPLSANHPLVKSVRYVKTGKAWILLTTCILFAGIDWHPNPRMDQSVVTHKDLPRFVMDSYEECRGPPRLFLLDK